MKRTSTMLEDKLSPAPRLPLAVCVSAVLLTVCLVVYLPCPVARAVALTAAQMYLDPASIPAADYTYPYYPADYTATFSNVVSLQVLPPMVEGGNSYYFTPTVDYTGDITGTDGSITFARPGPYFVLATYTDDSTALFDYGINFETYDGDDTSDWHVIPTPSPDVVIIDPSDPNMVASSPTFGNNTTVTNIAGWNAVVAYMKTLSGKHVELEGHGHEASFLWASKAVLGSNAPALWLRTLNDLVGHVTNLTFISCNTGQGADGLNFIQTVANALGGSAGYTDAIGGCGEEDTNGTVKYDGLLYINDNGTQVTCVATKISMLSSNIVLYRTGDGTQLLTNNMYVFLDEYIVTNTYYDGTPNNGSQAYSMSYVQTIAMPTSWYGANAPMTADGFALSQGQLTTSADGRFVVLTAFGATLTSGATPTYQLTNTSVEGASATAGVARVVALVDGFGHIDTTTVQTNANEEGDDIRAAASLDGANIWLVGSANGVKYTTRGSMISTQVCGTQFQAPYQAVNIFQDWLYIDSQTAFAVATNTSPTVNALGVGGLPTSYIATNFVMLAGVENGTPSAYPGYNVGNSANGFVMFNLNNANQGGAAPDTLYIADNNQLYYGESTNSPGAVLKYCYMSGTWSNVGVIGAVGATGLTGVQNGTNVTLYITSGGTATPLNTLYAYYDTSGFGGTPEDDSRGNGALGIQLTQYPTILPGVANYQLINTRGIAMAPLGGEYPTQSGNWVTNAIANDISVGPPYPVVCTGNLGGPYYSTNVYSIANFGTNAFTVTVDNVPGWLTSSFSGSTTIQPLGSITCQMVVNSGANSLTANQSGQFTFTTGFGAGNQSVNIGYVLNVNSLAVTPSSNCVAVGEPCGPFTFNPVNSNIYTLTNLTGLALQWGASISNNSPWVSLSSTGSLLAPFSSIAVTALVTAAANTYVIGTYHEIILLSNVSENTELDHDYFSLQVGYGFFDDFSTYAPGNVVDQGNWTASPADTNSPVQIAPFQGSGPLQYVVAGQTPGMMAQQPRKNFTGQIITNTSAYGILGMLITVTNGSSAQNSIFDFAAGLNGAGYYSCEAGMENSQGGYVWTLQLNQANTQATLGNTVWSFFTQYQVYIIGDEVNSNAWIFVNPTTSDLPTLLASSSYDIYINWNNINCSTCGGDTTNFGSVVMGQYSSGTAQCPGYAVAKAAASTNYTDVYNFLNGNPPTAPVSASFTVNNSSGTAPLTVQFTDTSTGSPAPDEWFWTFDNNVADTSTSENPSFTYSTPGTYTVQLIAANNCNWSTSSVPITVTSPLTPFQSWQTYYYGSPSSPNAAGNLDPYGSGMSNTNKFLAGFSTNKLATLHIISIARANTTDIRVTYLGANGDNSYSGGPFSRTNILEYSSGTGKGSYTNSFQPTGQTNILGGGSGLGTVTNMTDFYGATNGPARFYRVRVLLP